MSIKFIPTKVPEASTVDSFEVTGKDAYITKYIQFQVLRDRIIIGVEAGTRFLALTNNDRNILIDVIEQEIKNLQGYIQDHEQLELIKEKKIARLEEELRIANEKLTEDINA